MDCKMDQSIDIGVQTRSGKAIFYQFEYRGSKDIPSLSAVGVFRYMKGPVVNNRLTYLRPSRRSVRVTLGRAEGSQQRRQGRRPGPSGVRYHSDASR